MPGHPEFAIGAIASGGVRVLNEDAVHQGLGQPFHNAEHDRDRVVAHPGDLYGSAPAVRRANSSRTVCTASFSAFRKSRWIPGETYHLLSAVCSACSCALCSDAVFLITAISANPSWPSGAPPNTSSCERTRPSVQPLTSDPSV